MVQDRSGGRHVFGSIGSSRGLRNSAGFTLVELLVVIGIIALLISILLPALNKARRAAAEVVCQSNMRQFGIGIQMYADQNRGALPQKGLDGSTPYPGSNFIGPPNGVIGYDDPSIWFNALPPLVGGKTYYQILLDADRGLGTIPYGGGPNSVFTCPDAGPAGTLDNAELVIGNYFILNGVDSTGTIKNSTGMTAARQFPFDGTYVWNSKLTSIINGDDQPAVKMTQCRPGSEVVLMTEKINNPGEYTIAAVQQYNTAYPQVYNGNKAVVTSQGYVSNIGQAKADWRRFTTRHRGGGYLLFADGHVAWFSWSEAQIQPNQMVSGKYNANTSSANQPGKIIWSVEGPVN